MDDNLRADPVIKRLIRWASDNPAVRAVILTSSLTSPAAPVDLLSDYDVILAVDDVRSFYESRAWLSDFGPLLVLYRDPLKRFHGLERFAEKQSVFERFAYITQYENGLKIDFTLWTAGILPRVAAQPALPDELDVGYELLLDKDGLAQGLQPPSYRAHIPQPPSEDAYLEEIELFFHEATYVAKYLWRDDLVAAKHLFDLVKTGNLRQMLDWLIEIDHDWSLKPGAYGRYLKRYLRPEIWARLEETYVGPDLGENWRALFKTIDLFRAVGREVGAHLGYAYPADLHRRVTAYLQWVRALDPSAGPLALERRALEVEAARYEPILTDPAATTAQVDQAIEELRAIRMRIHAIDSNPSPG
jgi:aminoglycoside 6-adenylyltransferase